MKVEIDLNEILGDEMGVETLNESIKRQVVEKLTHEISKGISKKIDSEIAIAIDAQIKTTLESITPTLIDDLMNAEYTPVDRWGNGESDKKTTFRKQLVKSINEEMVYKKRDHYGGGQNIFSKAVDEVVKSNVDDFKTSFSKLVSAEFTKEALAQATLELRKRLGITV